MERHKLYYVLGQQFLGILGIWAEDWERLSNRNSIESNPEIFNVISWCNVLVRQRCWFWSNLPHPPSPALTLFRYQGKPRPPSQFSTFVQKLHRWHILTTQPSLKWRETFLSLIRSPITWGITCSSASLYNCDERIGEKKKTILSFTALKAKLVASQNLWLM